MRLLEDYVAARRADAKPYFVLGVDGEAEISIASSPHRVSVGQLLKLPAGQPHAVKAITRFKMLLVMIRA